MQTNQKGFTPFVLVLIGFTVIVGAWFVWANDLARPAISPESIPSPAKHQETQQAATTTVGEVAQPTVNNQATSTVDTAGWQTYRNEEYGFELSIPSSMKESSRGKGSLESGDGYNISFDAAELSRYRQNIISNIINAPDATFKDPKLTKSLAQNYVNAKTDNDAMLAYAKLQADLLCSDTEACYEVKNYNFFEINGYPAFNLLDRGDGYTLIVAGKKLYSFWFGGQTYQQNKEIFEKILSTFKFIGISASQKNEDNYVGWKTYGNEKYSFEIKYPPAWKIEDKMSSANSELNLISGNIDGTSSEPNHIKISLLKKGENLKSVITGSKILYKPTFTVTQPGNKLTIFNDGVCMVPEPFAGNPEFYAYGLAGSQMSDPAYGTALIDTNRDYVFIVTEYTYAAEGSGQILEILATFRPLGSLKSVKTACQ